MSQLLEAGFKTEYAVDVMRSIKPSQSGDYQGRKYGASVKIKSVNVVQEEDETLGLIEKETIVEFKVPCDENQLRKFNNFLRALQKDHKSLVLSGSLPRDAGKDSYTVTSYENADEIMARMNKK